jgi:ferritin
MSTERSSIFVELLNSDMNYEIYGSQLYALVVIIIAVQARQPGLDHRNLLSKERIDL